MTSKNAINLCSLNVNGINLKEKRNRVIEWFKAQKSLINVMQTYVSWSVIWQCLL
jgi:hypothetical protein